ACNHFPHHYLEVLSSSSSSHSHQNNTSTLQTKFLSSYNKSNTNYHQLKTSDMLSNLFLPIILFCASLGVANPSSGLYELVSTLDQANIFPREEAAKLLSKRGDVSPEMCNLLCKQAQQNCFNSCHAPRPDQPPAPVTCDGEKPTHQDCDNYACTSFNSFCSKCGYSACPHDTTNFEKRDFITDLVNTVGNFLKNAGDQIKNPPPPKQGPTGILTAPPR
ncbi:hypothetical protein EJ08DRAFT_715790, partial [Tothia fuscella]